MSKDSAPTNRVSRRRVLTGLGATAAAFVMPTLGSAAAFATPNPSSSGAAASLGFLYVNGNTAGANTVAGFARHPDGTLSPLAGSPFAIGGAGTGAPLNSQGAIKLSADKRFLLAVDGASNGIAVLKINAHGTLTPVVGSPFSSGGNLPVSIAVSGNLVYVANAGTGGSNYTGFILRPDGRLDPIAGSTVMVPDGAGIGDILFDRTSRHLVGVRVTTSLIDSFTVARNGHLTAAPNSPFAAQGAGPFGSIFGTSGPTRLYVSNAHGGAGNGSVSAFAVSADGTLTALSGSPYPDQQTAPCWVALAPNGRHLFTANAGSDSISSYAVQPDGTLSLVGSTPLVGGPGLGTFDEALDSSGHFLYQVDGLKAEISILRVEGGNLKELASSPTSLGLASGAVPFGIAIT
ncbi:MAG TPA: beta-propeller fold lactonase family protein [Chloroflexota bacterium]|nr:beta-propeller fold lactonase family protein [Chloroflexota bacterium]